MTANTSMTKRYEVQVEVNKEDWRGNKPPVTYAVACPPDGFYFGNLSKKGAEFLASELNKLQNTIEQLELELAREKARER